MPINRGCLWLSKFSNATLSEEAQPRRSLVVYGELVKFLSADNVIIFRSPSQVLVGLQ